MKINQPDLLQLHWPTATAAEAALIREVIDTVQDETEKRQNRKLNQALREMGPPPSREMIHLDRNAGQEWMDRLISKLNEDEKDGV